jgi:hypothetical protein
MMASVMAKTMTQYRARVGRRLVAARVGVGGSGWIIA